MVEITKVAHSDMTVDARAACAVTTVKACTPVHCLKVVLILVSAHQRVAIQVDEVHLVLCLVISDHCHEDGVLH